jgi:hypothetical protein
MTVKSLFNFMPICERMQGRWGVGCLMVYRNKKYSVQGVFLSSRAGVAGVKNIFKRKGTF